MPRISVVTLAIILLFALESCSNPKPQQFASSGVVSGQQDEEGHIWFEFDRADQRFVIDFSLDADAVFSVLKDSSQTGRSVTVHYDARSGRFDGHAGKPIYVARSLSYAGRTIDAEPVGLFAGTKWPWEENDAAEAALAYGIGLYYEDDYRGAHRVLAPLIEHHVMDPALQALALKTDGRSLSFDAYVSFEPGEKRDQQFLAALRDARAWERLAPKDSDPALDTASTLGDLGAQEEAIATLRRIVDTWPKERFWALIHMGSLYRANGDQTRALAALDELVRRNGPQDGMAYHYHRGWTLSELGRYAEADKELTKGIADQPDFAWAFVRRACVRASLGRLREAAADQQQAVAIVEADVSNDRQSDTKWFRRDRSRMGSVLETLRNSADKRSPDPINGLCEGYTDMGQLKRARSPLLPSKL